MTINHESYSLNITVTILYLSKQNKFQLCKYQYILFFDRCCNKAVKVHDIFQNTGFYHEQYMLIDANRSNFYLFWTHIFCCFVWFIITSRYRDVLYSLSIFGSTISYGLVGAQNIVEPLCHNFANILISARQFILFVFVLHNTLLQEI